MDAHSSLRSKQRLSVFDAYRGRGRRNNNLWLVYSVKIDRDFILPSDRQLVHWMCFLETESSVSTFDITPDAIFSNDAKEIRATELDAVVTYCDGRTEWHEVKSSRSDVELSNSQLLAQSQGASREGVKYRIFTDDDLRPVAQSAVRWLKPLSFAAAIRGQQHSAGTIALTAYAQQCRHGSIRQLLVDMEGYDTAMVLGLVSRLAIRRQLSIDLSKAPFNYMTPWCWKGGE